MIAKKNMRLTKCKKEILTQDSLKIQEIIIKIKNI
jgi:hypothetical protein